MATSTRKTANLKKKQRVSEDPFVSSVKKEMAELKEKFVKLEARLKLNEIPEEESTTVQPPTNVDLVTQNHLILKCIFQHLDVPSLKKARQVCSNWKENATSVLGQKSTIRVPFVSGSKLQNIFRDEVPTPLVQNLEVHQIMSLKTDEFFAKYGNTLSSLTVSYVSPLMMHSILEKKCLNLRKIHFNFHSKYNPEQTMESFLVHRPFLQSIQTTLHNPNDHTILSQLLKVSPNLIHLHLECKAAIQIGDFYSSSLNLNQLNSLTIKCSAPDKLVTTEILKQNELFLKTLTRSLLSHVGNLQYLNLQSEVSILSDEVPALLQRFKNSLHSLILSDWGIRNALQLSDGQPQLPGPIFDLPVLNNLQVCIIQSPKKLGINSIAFVNDNMPKLQVLRIPCNGVEIYELFKNIWTLNLMPHQNLTAITMGNRMNGLNSTEAILAIKRFFPNVSNLNVSLSVDHAKRNGSVYMKLVEVWMADFFRNLADLNLKSLTIGFDCRAEVSTKYFNHFKGLRYLKGLENLTICFGKYISNLKLLVDIMQEIPELRKLVLMGAKYHGMFSTLTNLFQVAKDLGIEIESYDYPTKNDYSSCSVFQSSFF